MRNGRSSQCDHARFFHARAQWFAAFDALGTNPSVAVDPEKVESVAALIVASREELYDYPENRDLRRRIQQIADLLFDDPARWPSTVPLAARRIRLLLGVYGSKEGAPREDWEKVPAFEFYLLTALKHLLDLLSSSAPPWMQPSG